MVTDPGGFLRRAVADFAAQLPDEDRDRARAEVRRRHLDLQGQLHFLASLLEGRRNTAEAGSSAPNGGAHGDERQRTLELNARLLGEREEEPEPSRV